jgi:transcriptional regulator with PAS, ATPase and Fis domain
MEKFISKSKEMQSIMQIVDRVVKSNINVIITGESGTGKEVVAKQIHEKSSRSKKPFFVINCASLTENLFESAMFGHVKGAFTGAVRNKTGFVEEANGGTIYLDEISELTLGMQAKLLRFAQSGEYNKVGSSEVKTSDVRIISSTSQRIESEIRNGNVREDLFYRLNTIVLKVPPLRKRKEDIPTFVRLFLKDSNILEITKEALEAFSNYTWPGNIRELENCIERIKIMLPEDKKVLTIDDVPVEVKESANVFTFTDQGQPQKLEEIERSHILNSLSFYNGNKSKTSNALGITLKTLYNKINKYREGNIIEN